MNKFDPDQPLEGLPERGDLGQLRAGQLVRLNRLLETIVPANRFWSSRLGGVTRLSELQELAQFPLLTKADLISDQVTHPPDGSNLTYPRRDYIRIHQTSGTTAAPLRWLDTKCSWKSLIECWRQLYRMMGIRAGDRIGFAFSFGPFLGFWAAFDGAQEIGCFCLATGGMSSQGRLEAFRNHGIEIVACTPTYAMRLLEVAREHQFPLDQLGVKKLIIAGESGAAVRSQLEEGWQARVFDHWGMTEVGPLAVECEEDPGHLYVLETECIAEVIDPTTLEPVPEDSPGELVITSLGRTASPVLRYRTGDIVIPERNRTGTGYHLLRLRGGIQGRIDEMITIRGNNFYPSALEELIRKLPEIVEYRIVLKKQRGMQHLEVQIELAAGADRSLAQVLADQIKARWNFQAGITLVDSLPRFEMKGKRLIRE